MARVRSEIDWNLLSSALNYYKFVGFSYVEVPWMVPDEHVTVTCDDVSRWFRTRDGLTLVGSAEQSFIAMIDAGVLKSGTYVSCTPCFRNEPVVDSLRVRDFMKVELIDVFEWNTSSRRLEKSLQATIKCAHTFFSNIVANSLGGSFLKHLSLVDTPDGVDIELGGIEIGSYGVRSYKDMKWVYGTGLAEPRFTVALTALNRALVD
jgi:hypothetical protein